MFEDDFTSQLHSLISQIPEIGQSMVTTIMTRAGREPSRFIASEDHPVGTVSDRPDFLLQCEDYDILCEHKLDSALGERQLERYLSLQRNRTTYLALITNSRCPCMLSNDVVAHDRYLRPRDILRPYFRWEDISVCIESRSEPEAQRFAATMRGLGMYPWSHSVWGDLFAHDPAIISRFNNQFMLVSGAFKVLNARPQRNAGSVGLGIRSPLSWLRLLYISIERAILLPHASSPGPYLIAHVYLDDDHRYLPLFRGLDDALETQSIRIRVRSQHMGALSFKPARAVAEYYTSLDTILADNEDELQNNLLGFATSVFEHARHIVENHHHA